MNTSKGSRASTAELSRKSVDGIEEKQDTGEIEVKTDAGSLKSKESCKDLEKENNEENDTKEQISQSPKNSSIKSGKSSPAKSPTEDKGLVLQIDQAGEDPIVADTSTPVEAVPIDKNEVQEESKDEEEKETEGKELSVELPPENDGGSPSGEHGTLRQESQNHSPQPQNDTPRPPSEEIHESVEPPVEKTTISPQQSQPELELDRTSPSSPDGKNDSAISSSSLSPEQEMTETEMERQGTPVIEVA